MLWGATRLTATIASASHLREPLPQTTWPYYETIFAKAQTWRNQLCDRTAKTCDGAATLVDKNLKSVAHSLLEIRAIVPAERQLFAVLKNDSILAVKPRLQFLNLIDLNDRRAVNAKELFRV
jgi:16S rRNA G1207 methylase RsmC